jgi:tetratricopeptide (TPR) repeat protein
MIFSSCDIRTADEYYNLAFNLEEKGEYEKAIGYLDKAIEKRPNFKPALLNRGADKSALENYTGAIEDYEKIIAFDSDNTLTLINIGNNYKRLKLYDKSISYYTRAINTKGAIKSDSIFIEITWFGEKEKESDYYVPQYEIEFERGISYAYSKKYRLAIKDLEQSIKYNYELPDSFSWIGEAYYHLKDTTNARKFLTKASKYGMLDARELLNKIEKSK